MGPIKRSSVNPDEREAGELCDARGDSTRVTCMLPKGHVKTIDDWHWATAETHSEVKTNIFEQRVDGRETHRWRSNVYELPREAREKAINKMTSPSEYSSQNDD